MAVKMVESGTILQEGRYVLIQEEPGEAQQQISSWLR